MLVLSRKCRESVVIGGSDAFEPLVVITVLEIKGSAVRLGFEADADVAIHRQEVWVRIRDSDRPDVVPAGGPPAPVA